MSEDKRDNAKKGAQSGKNRADKPRTDPAQTDRAQTDQARDASKNVGGKPGDPPVSTPPKAGNAPGDTGKSDSGTRDRPAAESKSGASAPKPGASKPQAGSGSGAADKPSAPATPSAATGAGAASTRTTSPGTGSPGTTAQPGGAGTPRDPVRPPQDNGRGSGGGAMPLAIIALIVAIVALIGSGWLYLRGEQKVASLDARVNTIEQGMQKNVQDVVMPRLSKFDQRLSSLSGQVDEHSQRIDEQSQKSEQQAQKQSEQQKQKLAAVQESVQAVQTRTAELADQVDGTINRSTLNQIESLLQTANQRLQLFDDPPGARRALELANDAIGRMGDPRLFEVRGEISDEIAALQALPNPDVEGLSLKLASMIKQVPSLPLASSVPSEYNSASAASGSGEDGGRKVDDSGGLSFANLKSQFSQGWGQFSDSVGNAFSGMFTIRQADGTQRALLPPDQAFFLSQNLQLQLRTARLALLKQNTESYQDGVTSARQWLGDFYDTQAKPVSSMRKQLDQMSGVKLESDLPDISKSLSMVRDLMAQRAGGDSGSSGSGTDQSSGGQSNGQPDSQSGGQKNNNDGQGGQ